MKTDGDLEYRVLGLGLATHSSQVEFNVIIVSVECGEEREGRGPLYQFDPCGAAGNHIWALSELGEPLSLTFCTEAGQRLLISRTPVDRGLI